ncbi:MAG TPA: GNAT family N-acetyltransferase [Chitinophagaceae bacterium]|nr:GNAT family N-acetyltransferase [Chitinophagaceae bacterium]
MKSGNHIQYLPHSQIDKLKWDDCIETAENGLIYAYSFYLDHMSENWDALVLNDYEVVMPLTWKKKYSIKYLYQPFLTAQSGIFGKNITEKIITDFIESIPDSFRYIDITLNTGNIFSIPSGFAIHRVNYTLDLNRSYSELKSNYRENIVRNIKKAEASGYTFEKDFDVEIIIKLAIQQMNNHDKTSSAQVARFRSLFNYLREKNMAVTRGIKVNDVMLASCVFFSSHNRFYYILVGNHPDGKTIGASHALIDAFIKEHSGTNRLLDFEGSDIPNLAFFYSSFGAKQEVYPALKINRLPFYLKWLKK